MLPSKAFACCSHLLMLFENHGIARNTVLIAVLIAVLSAVLSAVCPIGTVNARLVMRRFVPLIFC